MPKSEIKPFVESESLSAQYHQSQLCSTSYKVLFSPWAGGQRDLPKSEIKLFAESDSESLSAWDY